MVPVIDILQTSCRLIRRLHSMIFVPADPVIMASRYWSKTVQIEQSKSPKQSNLYFLDSPNDGPKSGFPPFRGGPVSGPSVFGWFRLDRWLSRQVWVWRYRFGELVWWHPLSPWKINR